MNDETDMIIEMYPSVVHSLFIVWLIAWMISCGSDSATISSKMLS
jgi:hypothetical protein